MTESDVSTKVYSYGAKPPVEGAALVDQQISRAHRYYNRLVELRRAQWEETEAVRCAICPAIEMAEAGVSAAEDAVTDCINAIRARNAAERRKRATAEEQAELAALKDLRAVAWALRKEVREAARDNLELQAALNAVYVEYHGKLIPGSDRRKGGHFKEARATCGIPYGTYLEVEKAVEAAAKTSKGPPAFKSWTGDGLIAVQIQGGITTAEAMARTDTRLRIGAPQRRSDVKRERTPRRPRPDMATVSLRIGSDGRAPIWCQVPIYWHRPLPADAIVMGAALVRRQVAVRRKHDPDNPLGKWVPYYEWTLNVTVRTRSRKPMATDGACGLDVGWRLMPDGALRVGYLVGSDGAEDEIVMDPSLLARWKKCDDLRSIRDQHFNEIRETLNLWMRQRITDGELLPDWLPAATAYLMQWRRKGRLAQLLEQWRLNRFDDDEAMFEALRGWHEHDVHLWQYERTNRLRAERIRREFYRTLAASLRMRYRRVIVEDCDWRTLTRLPAAASNESVNATARYWQRVAAVGMLRALLVQAGAVPVNSADTTRTCHLCGHVNQWEAHVELMQTCEQCGETWDQDDNAARVLLARGQKMKPPDSENPPEEPPGPGDGPSGPQDPPRVPDSSAGDGDASKGRRKGGRWQRRKADRSQRQKEKDGGNQDGATGVAIPACAG